MCGIVLASRMALAALSSVVSTCICRHTPMSYGVRVTGAILKVVIAARNAIKSHAITNCNAITAPSLRDDHICTCAVHGQVLKVWMHFWRLGPGLSRACFSSMLTCTHSEG